MDIYQSFFISPSVNGLRLFHVLVIVNKTAMNMKVQISLQHSVLVSLEYSPGDGILDHMVVLFLTLWGFSILSSIVAIPIYSPINSAQGFSFLHNLASISYLLPCPAYLAFQWTTFKLFKWQSEKPSQISLSFTPVDWSFNYVIKCLLYA